jgi:hypothetical protein
MPVEARVEVFVVTVVDNFVGVVLIEVFVEDLVEDLVDDLVKVAVEIFVEDLTEDAVDVFVEVFVEELVENLVENFDEVAAALEAELDVVVGDDAPNGMQALGRPLVFLKLSDASPAKTPKRAD